MVEGLYAAATGMMATEGRMEVIANNVANASTPGFRRQTAVQNGFYEVLLGKMRHPSWLGRDPGPGGGLRLVETFTDVTGGPVATTGNPLDVALSGPGYVAVTTDNGERFSRNGSFKVDADGHLATADGLKVASQGGGPISVGEGRVEIRPDATVTADGQPVGQIRLVEFKDPHMLTREGESLYRASAEALDQSAEAQDTRIESGFLEMSNVQIPYEMVQMTLGLRTYSANQRVINAFDETMSRVINEVGAPA